jgi:FKBP-type peptidyl-prolyl cis-trans isomerase
MPLVPTFTAQTRVGRDFQKPSIHMKRKHSLTIGLLAIGLVAARAQEIKFPPPGTANAAAPSGDNAAAPAMPAPAGAAAAPAPKAQFTDTQLAEEFGWFVGKKIGLTELEFNQTEIDAMVKGLTASAGGKDSPFELEKIGPAMDEFMQKKQSAYLAKLKTQNLGQSTAFFNKLKENKNIVELSDGLRYEVVKPGDGAAPKPTDTVKVNYTGTLIDGTVFDASDKHEPPGPSEFQLDGVIPGWTEGLQKISKGGKIKLYVPPHLAYGDDGRPGIPPGSTLVFDVELLDIKAGAPAPAPAAPATEKK